MNESLKKAGEHFHSGEFKEALKIYTLAYKHFPDNPGILNNLASTLNALGEHKKALKYFKESVKINPSDETTQANLGIIYLRLNKPKNARIHLEHSLKINPNNTQALCYLGILHHLNGEYEVAKNYYSETINLDPQNKEASTNLTLLLSKNKMTKEAVQALEKIVQKNPTYPPSLAHLIYQKQQGCRWLGSKKLGEALNKLDYYQWEEPMMNIIRIADPATNQKVSKTWADKIPKVKAIKNYPKKKNILTIGYYSDGFGNFPTAHNLVGVLENHDKSKFKINLYTHEIPQPNSWTSRISESVDSITPLSLLNDHEAAKKISKDGVDILVDLKGWQEGNRIKIFSHKPASIQVNYLGFPGTTGSNFHDYIIADKTVVPQKEKKYYTEEVVYLKNSYRPIDDKFEFKKNLYERKDLGLPDEIFVFASFNYLYKIEKDIFDTWLELLRETKSVLWLLNSNTFAKTNLQKYAKKRRISPSRIIFAPLTSKDKHLARMCHADLMLDTYKINGHTTTTDSLYAEVPVLTLKGKHFSSRVSESALNGLSLEELVAPNLKSYKKLASILATDKKQYKKIKNKLIKNKKTSSLFNTKKYTKNLEDLYIKMWDKHING